MKSFVKEPLGSMKIFCYHPITNSKTGQIMFFNFVSFLLLHFKSLTSESCLICKTYDDDIPLESGAAVGGLRKGGDGLSVTEAKGVGGSGNGAEADGGSLYSGCGLKVDMGGAGSCAKDGTCCSNSTRVLITVS